MASPFNVFRKNQKVMLVVLGLMAMISFVILAPLMDVMSGGGSGNRPENPVVLTSSYGELREYDVERLKTLLNILYGFLNNADGLRWQAEGRDPQQWNPPYPNEVDNQDAIYTYLLSNKADEMGIVVDDSVINYNLSQYKIGADKIREELSKYRFEDMPMSVASLFEIYRTDLKASRVRQSYGLPIPGQRRLTAPAVPTPADYFENYCRLHEQVQIESVAVPVEQFVDQIKDPSPEVLQAFFDEYKDRRDVPMNVGGVQMPDPQPGFKQLPKASFHYLEGNYLAYVDLAKQKVTDEEVAQYYEGNKRQFEKLNLLDAPEEAPADGLDLSLPELDKTGGTGPGDSLLTPPDPTAPEKEKPASEPPATDEKPASEEEPNAAEKQGEESSKPAGEGNKPAEEAAPKKEAAEEKKPEVKEATKGAEEEKPADEKPAEKTPAEAAEDASSSLNLDSPFAAQFVSFQADEEGTSASEKTPPAKAASESADTESAEKESSEKTTDPEKSPEKAPAKEPSAETTADSEKPASADDKPATAEGEKDPAAALTNTSEEKSPLAEGTPPEPEVPGSDNSAATDGQNAGDPTERGKQYKPLEEVADEIRQILAEERAGLSMLAAIEPLEKQLEEYWTRPVTKKLIAGDKDQAELPPGLLEQAEKNSFVYKETKFPLTIFELFELPLGQAGVPTDQAMQMATKVPFAQFAFMDQLKLFKPVLAEGDDGNKYLVWKVSESEEQVPKLADIKDEVVHKWKMIEARKLAESEAKRLADKARDLQVPLDKAFGDEGVPVQFSSPFTWLTRGAAQRFDFNPQIRLGEISGVTGADFDFMKSIFGMKVGEVQTIMNFPKDTVYVVRLSQRVTSLESLQEQFLKDEQELQQFIFLRPWDQQARQEVMGDVTRALIKEIEAEAKVEYLKEEYQLAQD